MTDTMLRTLERAASMGDHDAARQLAAARVRYGMAQFAIAIVPRASTVLQCPACRDSLASADAAPCPICGVDQHSECLSEIGCASLVCRPGGEQEDDRPTCDRCGNHPATDDSPWCETCDDERYACDRCGDACWAEDGDMVVVDGDGVFCESACAYRSGYDPCCDCGEWLPSDNLVETAPYSDYMCENCAPECPDCHAVLDPEGKCPDCAETCEVCEADLEGGKCPNADEHVTSARDFA